MGTAAEASLPLTQPEHRHADVTCVPGLEAGGVAAAAQRA